MDGRRGSRRAGESGLPDVEYGLGGDDDLHGRDAPLPGRVLLVGVALGLLALWVVTDFADGGVERAALPTAAATSTPALLVVPSPMPTPTPTPVPTPTPALSGDDFVTTRAAGIAWSQLAVAGPRHRVVYPSAAGLTVLDLANARVVVAPLPDGPIVEGVGALSAELGREGFGESDLGYLFRVDSANAVAQAVDDGLVAAVPDGGSDVILVDAASGSLVASHALPDGARLRALDGVGVTAWVGGEGTFVARPGGWELLTTGEVLAATDTAWVEQRCEATCEVLLVDAATGGEHRLPDAFAATGVEFLISPNGRYVLRITETGAGELYLPESEAVWWVNGSGIDHAAWAPDSTFVAWIDDDADPVLKMMLPERHDWIVATVDLLGGADPVQGELRVLVQR